jgi:hypothetical protein
MLLEQGKRLPTIEQYAAYLLPASQASDLHVNQFGMHTEIGIVLPVETRPGRFRLMPGPEFSSRLYRGQNRRYSPCLPSLQRLPFIDQAFWVVKVFELNAVLYNHPACVGMFHWKLEGLTFDFNMRTVAQHYGYPTDYLDFSRSRDVAMFFATCAFDSHSGSYMPLPSGEGVIYTADLQQMLLQPLTRVLPLGIEALPRPEAQSALALPLGPKEDLEAMPWINIEPIEITPALSARYFDMFDGGRLLFPSEPFDEHIGRIRRSRTYRAEALDAALSRGDLPPHPGGMTGAMGALSAAGYHACDRDVAAPEQAVEDAFYDWQVRWQRLNSRVRLRGVSVHYQANGYPSDYTIFCDAVDADQASVQ